MFTVHNTEKKCLYVNTYKSLYIFAYFTWFLNIDLIGSILIFNVFITFIHTYCE